MTNEQEYSELVERLARLEERMSAHIETTKENFEATKGLISQVAGTTTELVAALNKQKGFWGAMTMIVSAIAAAMALFKEFLIEHLITGKSS